MTEANERRAPFYLVWSEEIDSTFDKHFTREAAVMQAMRLAKGTPGEEFHVLMVIESAVVNQVTCIDYEDSDKPAPPCRDRTS